MHWKNRRKGVIPSMKSFNLTQLKVLGLDLSVSQYGKIVWVILILGEVSNKFHNCLQCSSWALLEGFKKNQKSKHFTRRWCCSGIIMEAVLTILTVIWLNIDESSRFFRGVDLNIFSHVRGTRFTWGVTWKVIWPFHYFVLVLALAHMKLCSWPNQGPSYHYLHKVCSCSEMILPSVNFCF